MSEVPYFGADAHPLTHSLTPAMTRVQQQQPVQATLLSGHPDPSSFVPAYFRPNPRLINAVQTAAPASATSILAPAIPNTAAAAAPLFAYAPATAANLSAAMSSLAAVQQAQHQQQSVMSPPMSASALSVPNAALASSTSALPASSAFPSVRSGSPCPTASSPPASSSPALATATSSLTAAAAAASGNKAKKAWTETERAALKDAVLKYRNKKNHMKLPWKQILSDALYAAYRPDRSKDAIMQQWKSLKKEVMNLPLPEGEESDAASVEDSATDSDASASSVSSPQVAAAGAGPAGSPSAPGGSGQPSAPTSTSSSHRRAPAKPKWTEKDTAVLTEAINKYGTDWRLILKDDSFARRLKYRNPVSLGKNFHRFHPLGIEQKKLAAEAKRARKEAREQKQALDELSSTSEDEDSDRQPADLHKKRRGGEHAAAGEKGGSSAQKEAGAAAGARMSTSSGSRGRSRPHAHKSAAAAAADSSSGSSDSGSSSDRSSDDGSSSSSDESATSPSSRNGGLGADVDAPIMPYEKPDDREVAHFRRCRHTCGCKSLTANGEAFVNNQAVMVRGSRRNHEVNQNLHPQCRGLRKECERLLGALKERSGGGMRKTKSKRGGAAGRAEAAAAAAAEAASSRPAGKLEEDDELDDDDSLLMDVDGDDEDEKDDPTSADRAAKKRKRDNGSISPGLANGQHAEDSSAVSTALTPHLPCPSLPLSLTHPSLCLRLLVAVPARCRAWQCRASARCSCGQQGGRHAGAVRAAAGEEQQAGGGDRQAQGGEQEAADQHQGAAGRRSTGGREGRPQHRALSQNREAAARDSQRGVQGAAWREGGEGGGEEDGSWAGSD